MMAALQQLYRVLASLIALVTAFFQTGIPKSIDMPAVTTGEYTQWVDPFIGTGGLPWASAMLFPGATAPFGLVRLSPDTTFVAGANIFKCGTAGYHYGMVNLWGFSHTRLSGTGCTDMGHFRVTPAVGSTNPADRLTKPLVFSHDNEEATAGYYSVYLPGINCLAELTATQHTGVHRYTYNTDKDAHLFIDATSFLAGGRATEGKVNINPEAREVTGEARIFTDFTGRYGGLKGYFVAQFSKPFESYATWSDGVSTVGSTASAGTGEDAGANLNFGNIQNQPVELKVGISFVSLENARLNLNAETGGLDFDDVRTAATQTWNTALSRIKIESIDPKIKTVFYTALYHTMIMPTNFTDVNGQYLGFKEQVMTADGFTYRTDMSIWDTFRTEHPLLNLIAPDVQRDCLKSLVRMARINGTLPRWPSGYGETGSMFGTPANMVITESFLKGITDFEVEEAYNYMKNTSLQNLSPGTNAQSDIQAFKDYGYVPADLQDISVSKTLELAWADGSTALLANALGKTEDAAFFTDKSMGYKNIWNPDTKYFQGKNTDGTWQTPLFPNITSYYDDILPVKVSKAYCEGGPRQWRWSVPQDTQGMINLFGKDYFVSELDQFMADASKSRAALDPGPGFWQGNQHDIHAPYLFDDAGRADLTQKWVRWDLAERHSTDVDGLDGNDDGGTMSAWYVFSAMGLYPVAGTDRYWIGSPNLDKAVINLGNEKTLTVVANNQSTDNVYVQSVTLNGVRLTTPSIVHSQIANGGTLEFTMGSTPAPNGGF